MSDRGYREIVANDPVMARYAAYQERYRTTVRESDRVLLDLVAASTPRGDERLLDIGCSTGNFLRHLARLHPGLELVGADLAPDVLETNRLDPELTGIEFDLLDLLDLPAATYDVVVANAVIYLLRDDEYDRAASSVASALRPGGTFLAFDFFHPFEQELAVREVSRVDPRGQTFHFRSYGYVRDVFMRAGFAEPEFLPFDIPIDLHRPSDAGDITSHTVSTAAGTRLVFRGAIYQPWCHLMARKPG